jgi:hypothetical protein
MLFEYHAKHILPEESSQKAIRKIFNALNLYGMKV